MFRKTRDLPGVIRNSPKGMCGRGNAQAGSLLLSTQRMNPQRIPPHPYGVEFRMRHSNKVLTSSLQGP